MSSCARVRPYTSYSENALFLWKSSPLLPGIDQTKQVCSNNDQGRVYQNCKFHYPRGRGSCARAWPYKSYSETALFLYQSSSLLPGIDQTNFCVYSNDDQGRVYQNCNFHISHNSEYVFSSSLSIYFTLIAIVLKDYDAAFLYTCWFLFIIIMGLLICKYAPFWQESSVTSPILR